MNVVPFVTAGDGTTRLRTSVFSAPLSFVPAPRWTKQWETADDVTVKSSDEAPPAFMVFTTGFASVGDAVETYQAAAECFGATMSEPTGLDVGKAIGAKFEIVGLPQRTVENCEAPLTDPTGTFVTGAWQADFRVVNVSGTAVTIVFWTTPELYEDHLVSADDMVASVIWKVLR